MIALIIGVVVVLAGAVGGVWLYNARQRVDEADDAEAPDTADAQTLDEEAVDAAHQANAARASDATDDDLDRPEPEYSPVGRAAATVLSMIPDPERGPRETVAALVNRPQPEHSRVGAIVASLISLVPKPLLGVRGTLFKRMAIKSIENYHKTAGGDAVAINAKAGQQLALEPVAYKAPEECEEGERPGWRVKGREKSWDPAKEGNSVNYLGKTPVVALDDDSHVEAGWLAPRIGQAIEMDRYWPLFTNPDISAHIDMRAGGGAANGAIADGGTSTINFELDDLGQYADDAIVDLNSGPGYDGMRISMSKAREWQAEHADSEQMQMQEDRGFLRGLANGDEGPSLFKLLLVCAAIILGTLFAVFGLPQLLGGSGVGAGGINPLLLGGL
jgi:hypothetical protein